MWGSFSMILNAYFGSLTWMLLLRATPANQATQLHYTDQFLTFPSLSSFNSYKIEYKSRNIILMDFILFANSIENVCEMLVLLVIMRLTIFIEPE